MANEIDKSYFYGEIKVPQLSNQAVQEELQMFIDEKEPEFLNKLLGESLYAAYKVGILVPEARFSALQSRLKKVIGTSKTSPIASYIYYWFMRNAASVSTGSGEKETKSENATEVSPRYKMAKAWSSMARSVRDIRTFLRDNGTYPEYTEPERQWIRYGDDFQRRVYNEWYELFQPINPFL